MNPIIPIISEHDDNEKALQQYWDEDADRLNRMAEYARKKGLTVPAPKKKEEPTVNQHPDMIELIQNSNPDGINQYTKDGSTSEDSPTKQIASAIERVSQFGRSTEDLQGDRKTAEHLVGLVSKMDKDSLYKTLTESGIEGLKPTDSKPRMLERLSNRITAAVRARERAEA